MVICQTPFRISFFGGGTDYPAWYQEHGGAVLSTSINKYGYLTCRYLPPFFDHKHRIVYSKIENVSEISQIDHPAVRAVFNYLKIEEGVEIHYDGDLPARSGVGSSSSFTVGLLNSLNALRGKMMSKPQLAEQTIEIEQNIIRETVGSQDQVVAAYGGFNKINFHKNGKFEVCPVIIPPMRSKQLNNKLLLFFTGFSRIAETVAKAKIENFTARAKNLHRMREMVDEALGILQSSNSSMDDFGRLLHDSWLLKKDLSDKVSNSKIDEIYELGLKNGALGGKILGAGGGGFILFYAPEQQHKAIRQALSPLIEVPFEFDYGGSQIILYNPGMATGSNVSQLR